MQQSLRKGLRLSEAEKIAENQPAKLVSDFRTPTVCESIAGILEQDVSMDKDGALTL